MPIDRYDVPPPAGWEDFEDLCRDLWALRWEDPDTRKHGRRSQPQAGVDVYGRPQRGERHQRPRNGRSARASVAEA